MESNLEQEAAQGNSSGLTRYRSAPSSYFSNIIDREFYEHIFNKPSSPETERVFSRFMNSLSNDAEEPDSLHHHKLSTTSTDSAVKEEVKFMNEEHVPLHNNYNSAASASHNFYLSSSKPPLPNPNPNPNLTSGLEHGTYSMGLRHGSGNNSTLIRHSSSPAGLFSQINLENVYAGARGMGTVGAVNNSIEDAEFSTSRRLKNQANYSSGRMSAIAEIGDKGNRESSPDNEAFGDGNDFMTGFQVGHWDDSAIMSDNVGGLKRFRENDAKPFSGLNAPETQNETGQSPAPLAHHLSLPNTSAEMAAIEKFLQFSDSVPCKIRAKRGHATHPRSIAERVRRTKISERMRKLQDLVPNMDKQTNTADMLDLAVDYIKDLQKQVQTVKLSVRVHLRSNNNGKGEISDLDCVCKPIKLNRVNSMLQNNNFLVLGKHQHSHVYT